MRILVIRFRHLLGKNLPLKKFQFFFDLKVKAINLPINNNNKHQWTLCIAKCAELELFCNIKYKSLLYPNNFSVPEENKWTMET